MCPQRSVKVDWLPRVLKTQSRHLEVMMCLIVAANSGISRFMRLRTITFVKRAWSITTARVDQEECLVRRIRMLPQVARPSLHANATTAILARWGMGLDRHQCATCANLELGAAVVCR